MGYTHYLTSQDMPEDVTDEQWLLIQLACVFVVFITASMRRISDLQVDGDMVFFNTPTTETLCIERRGASSFCKTGRSQDDLLISACMQVASIVAPMAFTFRSDGTNEECQPGRTLAYMALKTVGWER